MDADALFLSRLQFAFVVAFHFLLPAFTIGLASYIAVLESLYLSTKNPLYLRVSTYWIKIFAVSFGMGVVSGIVMPFQFGTNWSRYSHMTADIVAPLMAYEGLTAFFLEAGFLGVLLFGRKLVPQWAHCFAAIMVAVGTLMSTFWILVVNSWMQTPAGFSIQHGRFYPDDWWAVIWNPSFPFRFAHTVVAVYLTTAFTVIGVAAFHLRSRKFVEESRLMMKMGLALATILVPLQAFLGDAHGLNTLEHQPQKLAAMEGIWNGGPGQPAVLFAIPDEKTESNKLEISIPKLASFYLTHDWDGVVKGLKDFPAADRPPVIPVFFGFRIMVGMWAVMLLITVWSWWLAWRKRRYANAWFLRLCTWSIPVGYIAVTAGWVTTEVGRQPFVVYNQLRTADAVTPNLAGHDVVLSLLMYVLVYAVVFGAGAYYLVKLVRAGPAIAMTDPHPGLRSGRRARCQRQSEGPMSIDLVPIWTLILGVAVFMYVLLDGFDLGIGIMSPFAANEDARTLIMNTVAPIWDGNETWLILGGIGLFAAFPLAFAIIIPAMYFPILFMLLGLIFRGVAFEFRLKAHRSRFLWNHSFFWGSLIATFAQGVVLGSFVQGFEVKDNQFVGTVYDWFRPFPLAVGVGLVFGYLLLGSTWLVMKTEDAVQYWARAWAKFALVGVVAFIALISIWTPLSDARIAERWFSWPNMAYLAPLPLMTAVLVVWLWLSLDRARDAAPFFAAIGLFMMCFLGLGISLWPNIVPPSISLWNASGSPKSQAFLLIGTLFLLPIIIVYTGWSYYVFRGKVKADAGYH